MTSCGVGYKNDVLKKETESFLLAVQDQFLRTNAMKD